MPGIVVGVDGSGGSQQALEWAVKHAALEHVPLTVLAVHEVAASAWTGNPIIYPEDRPEEQHARQAAQEEVTKMISDLGAQPESVTVTAVSGSPAAALIDASADADLVVVGSRGAGGFSSLVMGSVSSKVVNHAKCPVVVVRH
ncbi:MAG TPA: universal stress protein [Streptosporangiaceae bacterium]|nr:universal stress protein [Streptosporangiaceae bacterium]